MSEQMLINYIAEHFPEYTSLPVKHSDLVFEERIKMNCFYCGKYNSNWKCPPKIPAFDFVKIFGEYANLLMIYRRFPFNSESYNSVRNDSSILLHQTLLKLEKFLYDNNVPTAISFIGGSCKLCKNGCGHDRCNNPYNARSPLEATGLNVIKTASNSGINIDFPPDGKLLRAGMILW